MTAPAPAPDTAAVGRLSAAQMRVLARVVREGERGLHPTRVAEHRAVISRLIREGLAIWHVPGAMSFHFVHATDLGRRVLAERASDSAFGLAVDPSTATLEPLFDHTLFSAVCNFHDARCRETATIRALRGPRPDGKAALITLDDPSGRYLVLTVDALGTCTLPGSPPGGWARLLDLAVDAGLQLPEPGGEDR